MTDRSVFEEASGLWRIPRKEVGPYLRAQDLLKRAEARLAEVEAASAEAFEEARRRGFDAGYAEGQTAASQETAVQIASLASLAAALRAEFEARIGELAIEISAHLTAELPAGELVAGMARRAVDRLFPDRPLQVRVHPSAHRYASEALEAASVVSRVIGDPSLELDGCWVETEFAWIDASFTVQLEALRKAFARDGPTSNAEGGK